MDFWRDTSQDEIAFIRQCLEGRLDIQAAADLEAAVDADLWYHTAVVSASHNSLFQQLNRTVHAPCRVALFCTPLLPAAVTLELDEYRNLIEAIIQRNPVAARRLAEETVGLAILAVEQVIRDRETARNAPHYPGATGSRTAYTSLDQGLSMKIAISGKGGVGKSTVAGTLARLYAADGRRVLAIDADPDANLASAIGLPAALRSQIRTISTERKLIEERTGAKVRQFGQMFKLNPEVSDIAGTIRGSLRGSRSAGAGRGAARRRRCACPESVLLKSLVLHLVLQPRRGGDPRHGSRHRAPGARHGHGRGSDDGGGRAGPAQRGDRASRPRDGCATRHPAASAWC